MCRTMRSVRAVAAKPSPSRHKHRPPTLPGPPGKHTTIITITGTSQDQLSVTFILAKEPVKIPDSR